MTKKTLFNILEILTIILMVIFIMPLFLIVMNSAKEAFDVTQFPTALPKDWTQIFKNMQLIWTSPNVRYQESFISSILITGLSLLFITFFSSMAAWVLVRTKSKLSNFFFLMFVAAMVIPFQIVMFPLLSWFRTVGEFTSQIPFFGFKLLRSYQGIILAYIGFGSSLSIFMFHGFIKSIPYELEEAATMDGCGKIKTFFLIVFPILKPIYVTVTILNGIWIWNDFLLPLLILGKGNKIQTIPLAVANFAGAYVKQWDLILTAIVMAIIPVVILFILAQKHIIKGMVEGSIK